MSNQKPRPLKVSVTGGRKADRDHALAVATEALVAAGYRDRSPEPPPKPRHLRLVGEQETGS